MIEGALPRKARQKYLLRGRAETHHPRPQRAANGLRSLTVIHTKYLLIRLFWKVSAIGTTRATGGRGGHQNEWNLIHAPDGGHV